MDKISPMKGIKGFCVLCQQEATVITPEQSQTFMVKLIDMLQNHIDMNNLGTDFHGVDGCLTCLLEIDMMAKFKGRIVDVFANEAVCSFCKVSDDELVSTRSYDNFHILVMNAISKKMDPNKKYVACFECIMFFMWFTRMRDNLFKKHPLLKLKTGLEEPGKAGMQQNLEPGCSSSGNAGPMEKGTADKPYDPDIDEASLVRSDEEFEQFFLEKMESLSLRDGDSSAD